MEIHVYDTYVKAADGHTMHFDVITGEKDHDKALTYGKEWLQSVGEGEAEMTTNECQFCHSQGAPEPVEQAIFFRLVNIEYPCLKTNTQSGQLKETEKQNGFADVSKQLIIISNSVKNTIQLYKKQFKLKLMN
jgi:hypothetical protein